MTITAGQLRGEYIPPSCDSVRQSLDSLSFATEPLEVPKFKVFVSEIKPYASDLPSYSGSVESIEKFKKFGEKYSVKAQDDTLNAADKVYDAYAKLIDKYPNAKIQLPEQPDPNNFAEDKQGYKSYKKQLKIWRDNCLDLIKMQEKNAKEGRLPLTQFVMVEEQSQPRSSSTIKDVKVDVEGDIINSNLFVGDNNIVYVFNTDDGSVTDVKNKPQENTLPVDNKPVETTEVQAKNTEQITENQNEKLTTDYSIKSGDYWYKIVSEQYDVSSARDINAIVRQLKNEYYQSNKESLNRKGIISSRGNFMPSIGSKLELSNTVEVNGKTYKLKR